MKAKVGDLVRVVQSVFEEEGGPLAGDIGTVTEYYSESVYPYRVRFEGYGYDNGPEGYLFLPRELEDFHTRELEDRSTDD